MPRDALKQLAGSEEGAAPVLAPKKLHGWLCGGNRGQGGSQGQGFQ